MSTVTNGAQSSKENAMFLFTDVQNLLELEPCFHPPIKRDHRKSMPCLEHHRDTVPENDN